MRVSSYRKAILISLLTGALIAAPQSELSAAPAKKVNTAARGEDAGGAGAKRKGGGAGIVAIVNDEPITSYEVEQRQRMSGLGANIQDKVKSIFQSMVKAPSTAQRLKKILDEVVKANPGKSQDQVIAIFEQRKKQFGMQLQKEAVEQARASALPALKKNALEELVEERLKLQEAKRVNMLAPDADVTRVFKGIAERNKMTEAQFAQHLAGMGVDAETMKARIRTQMSWNDVIRRAAGPELAAVSGREVEEVMAGAKGNVDEQVDMRVSRIALALPAKSDQGQIARRMQEAEELRSRFAGCSGIAQLIKGVPGARSDDLGQRRTMTIPEPQRSILMSAGENEMAPPLMGENAIELFAVCSRKIVKADEQKRSAAEEQLKAKKFELASERQLKDLRQAAHIEYR